MRLLCPFFLLFLQAVAVGAPPVLQVFDVYGGEAQRALPLPAGGTLIIGTATGSVPLGVGNSQNVRRIVSLVRLNASGSSEALPASSQFGGGTTVPSDAAIDQNGNIWIVGSTDSDDFPLVNPLFSQKLPYHATGFVTKLDPTGTKILFSTFLGGHQSLPYVVSRATNLATDPLGNAYILGNTAEPDFPQTSAVLGTGRPAIAEPFGAVTYTFVVKISPEGRLLSSVLLGGDKYNCVGGSHCVGSAASTVGNGIAVGGDGTITVAGGTNAINFPVTAHAFQASCACTDFQQRVGFVARISSTGNSLLWATYLGDQSASSGFSTSSIMSVAINSTGEVYLAGTVYGNFPTTPGVVQTTTPVRFSNVFVSKLAADGSALVYSTYLGGSGATSLSGLVLDSAGNVWVAGSTLAPDFPSLEGVAELGTDFVLELNSNATALTQLYRLPQGTVTQTPVFEQDGRLVLLASRGAVVHLSPVNGLSGSGILGFGNAASLQPDVGASPGELVTIFGVGLGPALGVTGAPDSHGLYPTQLGGVQVLIGSKSAPILYAGPNQINFQVPFQSDLSTLQVMKAGVAFPVIQISRRSSLGLFRSVTGSAAALNQDGTINSPSNPATPGSVVSLFATGLEQYQLLAEGALWACPVPFSLSVLNIQVTTSIRRGGLPILYAGAAPGLINGVTQINIQVPADLKDPMLTLSQTDFNTATSNAVQVYVH